MANSCQQACLFSLLPCWTRDSLLFQQCLHHLTLFSVFFFFPVNRAEPFPPQHQAYLNENASFLNSAISPHPYNDVNPVYPCPATLLHTNFPLTLNTKPDLLNVIVDGAAIHTHRQKSPLFCSKLNPPSSLQAPHTGYATCHASSQRRHAFSSLE